MCLVWISNHYLNFLFVLVVIIWLADTRRVAVPEKKIKTVPSNLKKLSCLTDNNWKNTFYTMYLEHSKLLLRKQKNHMYYWQ